MAAAAEPEDETSYWGGKARDRRMHKQLVCPKQEQRLVSLKTKPKATAACGVIQGDTSTQPNQWEAEWNPPVSGWEEHYFSLHV